MRPAVFLARPLQARVKRQILAVIATPGRGLGIDYDHPENDPGLFGPDSVVWKVHAHFPGMMAGGICALMMQTLHPLALAGVWDHSDFREDVLGRLRRTIAFVASTTYAPADDAQRQIQRVRAVHERIHGTAADGRPYSANDPALLTWVHCTEMWSFLRGWERYLGSPMPPALKDRYFDETRRIAEALGARDVPKSAAEVDEYFRSVRTQLQFDERSREVLSVLDQLRLPIPAGGVARRLFLGAGAALLPPWAQVLLGRGRRTRMLDRSSARGLRAMAPMMQAAMCDGVAARSCRRLGLDPAATLYRWQPGAG